MKFNIQGKGSGENVRVNSTRKLPFEFSVWQKSTSGGGKYGDWADEIGVIVPSSHYEARVLYLTPAIADALSLNGCVLIGAATDKTGFALARTHSGDKNAYKVPEMGPTSMIPIAASKFVSKNGLARENATFYPAHEVTDDGVAIFYVADAQEMDV